MMCKYTVLAHSESGYIVLCNKCNHFQVAFGTMIICLTAKQYADFKTEAREQVLLYENDGFPNRKTIQLTTFASNVLMMMSFNELIKLEELIGDAETMTEINSMINRLENGVTATDIVKKKYGYNE